MCVSAGWNLYLLGVISTTKNSNSIWSTIEVSHQLCPVIRQLIGSVDHSRDIRTAQCKFFTHKQCEHLFCSCFLLIQIIKSLSRCIELSVCRARSRERLTTRRLTQSLWHFLYSSSALSFSVMSSIMSLNNALQLVIDPGTQNKGCNGQREDFFFNNFCHV